MIPEIKIRAFTNDQYFLDKVFYSNSYKIGSLPDGSVVLDIGAHVGYFAINAVVRGAAKVYCFEPHRYNFECLISNTRSLKDSIVPYNFAVLFEDGSLELETPKFNDSKYFDFANIQYADAKTDNKEICPVFKLDTVLSKFIQDTKIELIKINLGGKYEADVICSSSYINCANSVCGVCDKSLVAELDKLALHMKTNGFQHVQFVDSSEAEETLFFFSKDELKKTFQI